MIPHFDHPWFLAGLLLLPLYAFVRHKLLARDAVPWAPLQYRTAPSARRRLAARARTVVELLLVAAVVVALASPYRSTRLEFVDDEGIDVALVLDISLSMLAEDFPPNRLEALRAVARDFVTRSGGHRVSVVVFAKDVFVHTPPTTDHHLLLRMLDDVSVYQLSTSKSGGTAVGDALLVATQNLVKARVEGRDQAVVLITDGESNSGIDPVLAARHLREQGVRLYTIGIGGDAPAEVVFEGERLGDDTPYVTHLDDRQLREVAEAAGGRYERASDRGVLERIFAQLARLESAPLEVRTVEVRRSRASLLAFLALPLYVAWLAAGTALRRPLR